MDVRLRGRRDISERVDVRHHVMPEAPLVRGDGDEVDLVQRASHLRDRLVRNRNTERLLRFREREPQLAPETVAHGGRPEPQHLWRRVALGKGGAVLGKPLIGVWGH